MEGKHYNTVLGGYTKWNYKSGIITKHDNEWLLEIVHFVTGIDGNQHRVFWHTSTLEEAKEYLDKYAE